jgi:hypothetical protein
MQNGRRRSAACTIARESGLHRSRSPCNCMPRSRRPHHTNRSPKPGKPTLVRNRSSGHHRPAGDVGGGEVRGDGAGRPLLVAHEECPTVVSRAWQEAAAAAQGPDAGGANPNPNPVVAKVILSLDPLRDDDAPSQASRLLLLLPLTTPRLALCCCFPCIAFRSIRARSVLQRRPNCGEGWDW